jgi:hypothetical protein
MSRVEARDRVAQALGWATSAWDLLRDTARARVAAVDVDGLRRLGVDALGAVHASLRHRRRSVDLPPPVGELADRFLDWLGRLGPAASAPAPDTRPVPAEREAAATPVVKARAEARRPTRPAKTRKTARRTRAKKPRRTPPDSAPTP